MVPRDVPAAPLGASVIARLADGPAAEAESPLIESKNRYSYRVTPEPFSVCSSSDLSASLRAQSSPAV